MLLCKSTARGFFIGYFILSRDEEPTAGNTQCPKNTELRWMSEVSASIYSTPLVADINRCVVLSCFVAECHFVADFDILLPLQRSSTHKPLN
jgi:hypothetical protein